jgi:hypothetical protein
MRHDKDALAASDAHAGTIGSDDGTRRGNRHRVRHGRSADFNQGGTVIKGGTRPALDGKDTLTQNGGRLTEI